MNAGVRLNLPDLLNDGVQGRSHGFVHRCWIMALHEVRNPPVAAQQLLQLFVGNARQNRWVSDLIAVQMQNGQYRAVADGIQELVGMPRGGKRSCLGLAVADHASHHELGIVEYRAECMTQRVTEFTALVNRSRTFRRSVARNPTGKRELSKQPLQAGFVLTDLGIDLAVRALQIGTADDRRTAMS